MQCIYFILFYLLWLGRYVQIKNFGKIFCWGGRGQIRVGLSEIDIFALGLRLGGPAPRHRGAK